MSNDDMNDENHDSYQIDSGYLTFASQSTYSYCTSPCRMSPSNVVFSQLDSPASEYDLQSPIHRASQRFLSTMDYEKYVATRKHFDILTQLDHRNAFHIIDQILKHLSKKDVSDCSDVSRKWNSIVQDHHRRQQTRNVKRNLFQDSDPNVPMKHQKLNSTPMQMLTNTIHSKSQRSVQVSIENTLSSPQLSSSLVEENIHLTASTMTFRYGYLKYLHGPTVPKRCPLCAFVSIVDVNDQHGICTNPLCRNSFCQYCSGPYHPSSPCKTTIGPVKSPRRKRPSISPIFSNKTRNNLRRLLIR